MDAIAPTIATQITPLLTDSSNIVNQEDLEQNFEIRQRGAVYDAVTGKRRYDNYQLIKVNPETDEHLDVLQFLDRGMSNNVHPNFTYFTKVLRGEELNS